MTKKSDAINYNFWVSGLCLVGTFLYLYKDVFSALVQSWVNVPAHSHGFFIPLVSLYILWEFRHKITSEKIYPNISRGTFLLLLSSLLLVFGKASMVNIVQQGSMLVMVCGLIVLLLGNHFMKNLWIPVGYLILMFPFLDGFIRQIQWPFQMLSAKMAAVILQGIGVPVLLTGNYIELPGITLEVARACSGIHYMVSIIAIVILLMLLLLKKTWTRVLLFVIGVVVGITVNWLRIVLIALWVYYSGKTVHGPGHIFQGLFISVSGFFLLFAAAIILRKITSSTGPTMEAAPPANRLRIGLFEEKKVRVAWIIAFSILVGTAVYSYSFSVKPVPLPGEFSGLLTTIPGWQSTENDNQVAPRFNVRDADVVLNRVYSNAAGEKATLYIGYFEYQRQGKEIIHSNLQTLYNDSDIVQIDLGHGEVLSVNKVLVEENGNRFMSMYWYNINGRYIASNYLGKIYSAIDSLLFKRSNGTFIGVSVEINNKETSQQYEERLTGFIRVLFPSVKRSLSEKL